ncbi:MAG: nucleoside kinase [Oscillospiraceae bacterium]|nr:nucleoside kinase [Oscillospiraceae bacterium]MDD4413981.1 nucleoside kinase [Oscillospiraceae bacterium]
MKHFINKRRLKLEEINERVRTDLPGFIQEERERYLNELDVLARHLAVGYSNHCLVMLSGPSSSGKTTTAKMLSNRLRELGIEAHTISMDDFYRGREQAPKLDNGRYDYEALEALRLADLEKCMRELIRDGRTLLPKFDFNKGRPFDDIYELSIKPNAVVIFEGIHAINPYFEQHLPSESLFKLFVNTVTPIYKGDLKFMARRMIRLTRRLLRDERFRNSPVVNTLEMWQEVVRGENEYMFPYVDTVDYLIDTTHAYESCFFAPLLMPSLKAVSPDNPHTDTVQYLYNSLSEFEPLSLDKLPGDSLLREFVGDKKGNNRALFLTP